MAIPDLGDGDEDIYMAYQGRVGEVTGFMMRNQKIIGVLDYHRDMGDIPGYQLRYPDGTVKVVPADDCQPSTLAEYNAQGSGE